MGREKSEAMDKEKPTGKLEQVVNAVKGMINHPKKKEEAPKTKERESGQKMVPDSVMKYND